MNTITAIVDKWHEADRYFWFSGSLTQFRLFLDRYSLATDDVIVLCDKLNRPDLAGLIASYKDELLAAIDSEYGLFISTDEVLLFDKNYSSIPEFIRDLGKQTDLARRKCLTSLDRLTGMLKAKDTPKRKSIIRIKGKPGRRGYPIKVLEFAMSLRKKDPLLKAHAIRLRCLEKFSEDEMPPDGDSFRAWMNRNRTNRTN